MNVWLSSTGSSRNESTWQLSVVDWDVFFPPQNSKLVTASSNNTVQIHTFPDGDPDGILTRFTTNATHVTFNRSGLRVAAGSRYWRRTTDILRIYFVMMMMMSSWLGSFILMYLTWSLRGSTAERRVNVTFTLSNDAHALSAPAPPVATAEAVVRNVSVVFSVA